MKVKTNVRAGKSSINNTVVSYVKPPNISRCVGI